MAQLRVTNAVKDTLAALLHAGSEGAYGRDIAKTSGVSRTTIYDVLGRVEAAGWATSDWEKIQPQDAKRPRRRLYRLTGEGERVAIEMIETEVQSLLRRRVPRRWLPDSELGHS